MSRLITILLVVFSVLPTVDAQEFLDPVKWEVSTEKKSDNTYIIHMDAVIDAGWHLYSQKQFGEEFEGPIATEFEYVGAGESFNLIGETIEPDLAPVFDPVFELDVIYFDEEVRFSQEIEITDPALLSIDLSVYYSVCDDEKCLPPDVKEFTVNLESGSAEVSTLEVSEEDKVKSAALDLDLKGEETYLSQTEKSRKGYFTIFLLGFVGGLIALLTPCVFPMIPLTVSFFTKGGSDKRKGLRMRFSMDYSYLSSTCC